MRMSIFMKETELVLIFRELMRWDFFVPEHIIEAQIMKEKMDVDLE